jgi:hypothetical protein
MEYCNPVNILVESGIKLSHYDEGKVVDATLYRSLVGNLRYLTCTRPDITYGVDLVSRYMEEPKMTHWKTIKKILRYVKSILSHDLFYSSCLATGQSQRRSEISTTRSLERR